MYHAALPENTGEPTIRMTGRELADALGVAPSTLSEASKTGRAIGAFEPSEWAERDDEGTVMGYDVPEWIVEELTSPSASPAAPPGRDWTSNEPGALTERAEQPERDEDPVAFGEHRSARPSLESDRDLAFGAGDAEGARRTPGRRPEPAERPYPLQNPAPRTSNWPSEPHSPTRSATLLPSFGSAGPSFGFPESPPVNAAPFGPAIPPNAGLVPHAAAFGLDTMRDHYERMYEAQDRENQRLREENQRLRDELRDERDRTHREKMEALAEQMRSEAKEMRERFKLREEMVEMRGELLDARSGREGEGGLVRFLELHGDRFLDVVEGAVDGISGLAALAAPPAVAGELPAAASTHEADDEGDRTNPGEATEEEVWAWLGNLAETAATTLLEGTPDQIERTAAELKASIPQHFLFHFARALLVQLMPVAPDTVAARLRTALAAVAPVALQVPASTVMGLARSIGVVASDAEAAWLERVLPLVQAPEPIQEEESTPPPSTANAA